MSVSGIGCGDHRLAMFWMARIQASDGKQGFGCTALQLLATYARGLQGSHGSYIRTHKTACNEGSKVCGAVWSS